jgi:membrane associated rhomboid family serine protease
VIPLRDNLPTDNFPVVTLAIIVINALVFLLFQGPSFSLSSGDTVETKPVVEYGAIPYRITHPADECALALPGTTQEQLVCEGTPEFVQAVAAGVPLEDLHEPPAWITIFSSMFMHGGWLHIIFNMLFLWIFGNNIEDSMGPLRFIFFYLLGGLAAAGLQVAIDPNAQTPLVGASGAIAGVLGGYALLYPRARILTMIFVFFIFLVEIPAFVMLGIWIALQFLPAVGQLASPEVGQGGGVAYFAHIGGFVFGLAAIKLFAKRRSTHYGEPKYPVY